MVIITSLVWSFMHYLPVSKPDAMFLCFIYNSVYMSFVTHLVWCSLYVLLFRACQVSIIIFQDCQAGTACMCAHY